MTAARRYKVPAVVVGGGLNGLGLLRSLACAGVPVIVLVTEKREPAMQSRYGRKVLFPASGAASLLEALEKLAESIPEAGERPVLFLTQEESVSIVSAHRKRVERLYRFTLPEPGVLTRLMHKGGFHELAEQAGEKVPRSLHVNAISQVEAVAGMEPPLVVKPGYRNEEYTSAFRKAYRLETVAEAQRLICRILPTLPDVIVQEWIEGADSELYFCLQFMQRCGEPAAAFVGRKLRSWPPRVGGTASCAPAPEASSELIQTTSDFFRQVGVVGMAGLEYKRDRRTGEFLMVEPTVGRSDYQEEVATLNGVNIPLGGYCAELDLALPSESPARRARIWRDRMADQQSARVGDGVSPKQIHGQVVNALWRWHDPAPALRALSRRALRRAGRSWNKVWPPQKLRKIRL